LAPKAIIVYNYGNSISMLEEPALPNVGEEMVVDEEGIREVKGGGKRNAKGRRNFLLQR